MKKFIIILLSNIFAIGIFAQDNTEQPEIDNSYLYDYKRLLLMPNSIYEKENIKYKKPIPYPLIREADVGWARIIWRIIDVREKMNQPLYYPTTPMDDRKNLFDILVEGIRNEGVTAYNTFDDDFTQPITLEEIYSKFDFGSDTINVRNRLTGEIEQKIIENSGDLATNEVLQYMLKEQWIFDKKASTLKVRIIGICPIRIYDKEDYNEYNEYSEDLSEELPPIEGENGNILEYEEGSPPARMKLFWVYFPEVRPLLARHAVFNPQNDVARVSFDDVFMKRRFNSYISQVSNVHDNRNIAEYKRGIEKIIESERIKKMILDFENDLWEY